MSQESPSIRFLQQKMAIERTVMANERTFLSYSRTAMAFVIAGLSFLHLTKSLYLGIIGAAFIPVGAFILVFAIQRFKKMQNRIREEKELLHIHYNNHHLE
jgi:putative membrane protein